MSVILLESSQYLGRFSKAWLCYWMPRPVGCPEEEEVIWVTKMQTEFRELISGSAALTPPCIGANYFASVNFGSHLKTCIRGPWRGTEFRKINNGRKQETRRDGMKKEGRERKTVTER